MQACKYKFLQTIKNLVLLPFLSALELILVIDVNVISTIRLVMPNDCEKLKKIGKIYFPKKSIDSGFAVKFKF